MSKKLRALIVEDSEIDAILLVRELQRGGYQVEFERVDTADGLERALGQSIWEIIICDYSMPQFDGFSALQLFKRTRIDIPFIVVSGHIGEDVAVGMMKAGAHDYLLKDKLARLVPAIERELNEAAERREHRRAEQARAHLAAIVASTEDAIISTTIDGTVVSWNAAAERIFGHTDSDVMGKSIIQLAPENLRAEIQQLHDKILRSERILKYDTQRIRKDGTVIHVSLTISPIRDQFGEITSISTIARDITDKKRVEQEREDLLQHLRQALADVKTLSGLLPICSGCKKIRDDQGYWQQVEIFIRRHSDAEFTHGFCPDCMRALYPEFADKALEAREKREASAAK
jgi:PAS domain S-box-containing protein